MLVPEAIARALAAAGIEHCFGLIGSGNLSHANAMREAGIRFHGARHESNATSMAIGFARATDQIAAVSVHQGPGFTNTLTHLTEAAKGHIPMVVVAADSPPQTLWSNFKVDQAGFAREAGAIVERVRSAATAAEDAGRAVRRARQERRPVVLNVATDLANAEAAVAAESPPPPPYRPAPGVAAVEAATDLIAAARRPALVAGRGAALAGAAEALEALGRRIGAVLATSAGAHGLFAGSPSCVGIAGGFSSPLGREVLGEADLVLGFGAALNHWTTDNGRLIAAATPVVQVDLEASALGMLRPATVPIQADATAAAQALLAEVERRDMRRRGFDLDGLAREAASRRWRDEPYVDEGTESTIDPRTLTIALDDLLPRERTVVTDGGHFLGYPSMYLAVPDARGFVFPQAFQAIGQGLGAAIGAAIGRPDRLAVAALGDGGALMAISDLETVARYRLPMLVLIYNDAAYGAEVHHFEPQGLAVDLVQFPDADFAALARALGIDAATVRGPGDLAAVEAWLERRDGPFLIDAKVNPEVCAEWLPAAFAKE